VTFFTIDAADQEPGLADATVASASPFGANAAIGNAIEAAGNLRVLAAVTGGRAFKATPDLDRRLSGMVDDLGSAYSLGFAASAEGGDGFRRLDVRVRREDVKVRHREGFRRRAAVDRASDAALATAAFGGALNPLGIAVEAVVPKPSRSKTTSVPVSVRVPIRSLTLLPLGDHQEARVAVHFALRDDRDRLHQLEARTWPLSIPNAKLAAALRQYVTLEVELPMRAGSYDLAVGVHDEIGNARSTVLVPIVVAERARR
jgi:hypothetical protein